MTSTLSPNTKAILLLTAPLIAGRGSPAPDLLTPGEYKRLARHLREIQHQPADLVSPDAFELVRACQPVIDQTRLQRLLERGFLLSQAIERWHARAIWVISRADAGYPRRLKVRLREDAPAVLYGCGDIRLLESGGLAVVGSRHVDEALINYSVSIGNLAARAGRTLVSGGAKGVDQAAMQGALEVGGKVCGVLADSLEKMTLTREHRNLLLEGRLTLISPYDPNAGFNVGNAMQRNKVIYALADASLVVSSDIDKGGTWAGAIEQLEKLKFVPVYVRSTGAPSAGLDALRKRGALAWPNPNDVSAFEALFIAPPSSSATSEQGGFTLVVQADELSGDGSLTPPLYEPSATTQPDASSTTSVDDTKRPTQETHEELWVERPLPPAQQSEGTSPAETLFAAARDSITRLLTIPMKDADVATALDVSTAQAKAWLQRLVEEGLVEKQKKPAGYIAKQTRLFM
jgi:predicted Rossmann fold nucleotide-binding protein DprA/Smf involved in DNA uptake